MRKEDLSDAMNYLSDEVLEETNQVRSLAISQKKKTGRGYWQKWMAVAAGLAVIVYLSYEGYPPKKSPEVIAELPKLTVSEFTGEGMGFEGLMAYDISELVNANPWKEELELETLPVYKNQIQADVEDGYRPIGGDFETMEAYMYEVAEGLGLEVKSCQWNNWDVTGIVEGAEIEVTQDMVATIWLEPEIALPDGCNFNYHASYEDMENVAVYLKEEYEALLDMENAVTNISGGDYNIYGERGFDLSFYEGGGSITEQILNYNFNTARFSCNHEGKLSIIRKTKADLSQKVGDYPILTVEEARERLLDGAYITTVPYELPGEDAVKKVELVYRTSYLEAYFMPYYRFYVEVENNVGENGDLNSYGAYYVPAVRPEYIEGEDMSLWDGWFN